MLFHFTNRAVLLFTILLSVSAVTAQQWPPQPPGSSSGGSDDDSKSGGKKDDEDKKEEEPPPPPPAQVTCEVSTSPTIPESLRSAYSDAVPASAFSSFTRIPDLVFVRTYCHSDKPIRLRGRLETGIPSCGDKPNGLCKAGSTIPVRKDVGTNRVLVAHAVLRNHGSNPAVVNGGTLRFRAEREDGENDFPSINVAYTANLRIESAVSDPTCRVIVSGALDPIPENQSVPEVRVSNGKLFFSAVVDGVFGAAGAPSSVTWSGGPNSLGIWDAPVVGTTSEITARLTSGGRELTCSIRVRPLGQTFAVKMQRFGECSFFSALRTYYHMDASNKGFQQGGYPKPLQFAGLNGVDYGKRGGDVPFRGVLNGAASLNGVFNVGLNGAVTIPPLNQRRFSKAVVVARKFDGQTGLVSNDPVAWGILDYSNYNITRLEVVDENLTDDDEVVFQAFLAHAQPSGGVDLRGGSSPESAPFHRFLPGSDGRDPIDRIIPFVNDSCALLVVSVPTRSDKKLSPELASAKLCAFSKPFQFSNFRAGRVALNILHVVPEHATHTFPGDLMRTSRQPTCQANRPNDVTSCWNVSAAAMGQNTSSNPFEDHSGCRTYETITQVGTVCGQYGCYNYTYPVTVEKYQASCNVLESKAECDKNLAIRFSGYNQMMLASLGCAAKYDRPGEAVTATLMNQGIIPYMSTGPAYGGSDPRHWEGYPAAYGATNGYACIPCRFASDAAKAGRNLGDDTGALPVDQDATSPRKPIYSFSKSQAPRECVRNVKFEVRYFGSGACDGTNVPDGHFCSSNIPTRNCSTTDVASTARPFGGGGNIAGEFTIPVCPNSGFEYDSVSVSWSPILVDTLGNGISVSREFRSSVTFDIKGNGRPVRVDWPVNTDEVAFLARPDSKGRVTSIKHLFGDHGARNGFEALRAFDKNRDGIVDRKDPGFSRLVLWFDRNRNGVADPGEIESLADYGVSSLPLAYAKPVGKGIEGRTLSSVYFNDLQRRYLNIEDHYFYEYQQSGKKVRPRK